ncbi:unnamed protein product [Gemmata massiliana]|uniref:Uncharacterized protein n=1 Tax=Gemmata massiliana TaxID=1210884 RepID=A0A6P2CRX8_9BACT|nr:unnamed protein product [Gemmata massiliana]
MRGGRRSPGSTARHAILDEANQSDRKHKSGRGDKLRAENGQETVGTPV